MHSFDSDWLQFPEDSLVDDSLLQDDDEEEDDNESRSWRRWRWSRVSSPAALHHSSASDLEFCVFESVVFKIWFTFHWLFYFTYQTWAANRKRYSKGCEFQLLRCKITWMIWFLTIIFLFRIVSKHWLTFGGCIAFLFLMVSMLTQISFQQFWKCYSFRQILEMFRFQRQQ